MTDRFATLLPYFPSVGAPQTSNPDKTELSNEVTPDGDGKSVYNPPRDGKSHHYDALYKGDQEGSGEKAWWDFHIYHLPNNPNHVKYAEQLYEAVRREFPELRVYRFFDKPIGPHPIPMFEINVFNPTQLGALFSWFVQNRGPCSVLIHPNTGDDVKDHTVNASWLGEKVPLDVDLLRALEKMQAEKQQKQ